MWCKCQKFTNKLCQPLLTLILYIIGRMNRLALIYIKLFLFCIILSCTGCSKNTIPDYSNQEDFFQPNESFQAEISSDNLQDISDESMTSFFQDFYGMKNLTHQNLYWNTNELQMDFYFNNSISLSEIDSARSFSLNKFVLGIQNQHTVSPYELWMRKDGKIISIPIVKCRIFVQNTLVFQDSYKEKELAGCYENSDIFLTCREISADAAELTNIISKDNSIQQLRFQKSIKEPVLLILLDVNEFPSIKFIDKIKTAVQKDFSSDTQDYSHIVLSIICNETPVFRSVFNNSKSKKVWESIDWLNTIS